MTHREFVDSLLEIAAFYEQHPDVPLPYLGNPECLSIYDAHSKEDFIKLSKAFGKSEKRYGETFFELVRKFGSIELKAMEYREKICVRKVVASEIKRVEKQIPVAYKTEIVEEVVEQVEWECHALNEKDIVLDPLTELPAERLRLEEKQ